MRSVRGEQIQRCVADRRRPTPAHVKRETATFPCLDQPLSDRVSQLVLLILQERVQHLDSELSALLQVRQHVPIHYDLAKRLQKLLSRAHRSDAELINELEDQRNCTMLPDQDDGMLDMFERALSRQIGRSGLSDGPAGQ